MRMKHKRVHVDLNRVHNQLDETLALYDQRCAEGAGVEDDGPESVPLVMFKHISREDFSVWLCKHEGDLRRWEYEPLTDTTGRVVVFSFPTRATERTAGVIAQMVLEQIMLIGNGIRLMRSLVIAAAPTLNVGDRDQEPSMSLIPAGLNPNAFPNLIVEVSHKNQTWPQLVAKLRRWMGPNTTVLIAIGIRICPRRRRFMLMRRNPQFNADRDDDGDRLIVQEGHFEAVQQHRVAFTVAELYVGATIPAALDGHQGDDIVIDLVDLLDVINTAV